MIELQYAQQGVHYNGILIEHKVVAISKALIATVAQLEATIELLDAAGYRAEKFKAATLFPGVVCCAKCGFSRTYINANSELEELTAGDSKPEACPNGCGPLWHDTYRNQYNELYYHTQATQAELAALKNNRVPLTLRAVVELRDIANGCQLSAHAQHADEDKT